MDLMQAFMEAEKRLPVQPKPATIPKPVSNIEKPMLSPNPNLLKPVFENTDFTERVAILIESGGHDPDAANRLAINELGGEQLDLWRYHIERLPATTTIEGIGFIKAATAFLASPMGAMAAFYCWDDLEIFGVLNGPPRAMVRRHDAMGLVPTLAWSRIGTQLIDIEPDRTILKTHTGNTLIKNRKLTSCRMAVPVWWSGILHKANSDFDQL